MQIDKIINEGSGGTVLIVTHEFPSVSTKQCKDILEYLRTQQPFIGGDPDLHIPLAKWSRTRKIKLDSEYAEQINSIDSTLQVKDGMTLRTFDQYSFIGDVEIAAEIITLNSTQVLVYFMVTG